MVIVIVTDFLAFVFSDTQKNEGQEYQSFVREFWRKIGVCVYNFLCVKKVEKSLPIYGDPDDTSHKTGDDRPLPDELKNRINIYIEKRVRDNPEKYKNEIEESSTFNALIRKEIKAGNL
jgi:hypothetical protein